MANKLQPLLNLLEQHGWVQGHYGNKAGGFCLMGGVNELHPRTTLPNTTMNRELYRRVRSVGFESLIGFNDHPYTTFEDVRKLLSMEDV